MVRNFQKVFSPIPYKRNKLQKFFFDTSCMDKIIKIKFEGFWPNFNYKNNNFFTYLEKNGLIEVVKANPDIVIYSEYFKSNFNLAKKKILYYVENLPQKNWIFNYTMSYSKASITNLNFYNFFYYPFFDEITSGKLSPKYKFLKNKEKKKYINFIHSNPNGEIRNKYFSFLSKFKKIDSYGKVQNNMGILPKTNFPEMQKNEILSDYKYTIAFENSFSEEYFSEKIWQPISLNSIPIYYGPKSVFNIFNKKKIIYITSILDFKKSLKVINEIDSSKDLYQEILNESIFKDDDTRIFYSYKNLSINFIQFVNKVINDHTKIDSKFTKYITYLNKKIFSYVKKM